MKRRSQIHRRIGTRYTEKLNTEGSHSGVSDRARQEPLLLLARPGIPRAYAELQVLNWEVKSALDAFLVSSDERCIY